MSETGARPPMTVVPPGEGRLADLGSIGVAFKHWGPDTGGSVAVVEHPFPVGALVTPHLHTREGEYPIATGGFRSGFECFFRDLADLLTTGSPSLADTAALAQSYGLEFDEPDWLPGVVARCGLDPLDGT